MSQMLAQEALCPFCGDLEYVGLSEVWEDGAFQIACCCDALYDAAVNEMADDPAWARTLLKRAGIEELTGHRLRRVADNETGSLILDYQLELHPVSFSVARAFVGRHHAHCRAPVTWRFGSAILNGRTMLGVVMVGNPVARALNGRGVLEVNRLCIRRDVPSQLAWNAASMLYGWAAREATRRGWVKIITYTRIDEQGTSVRAAGWKAEATVKARGWHSVSRPRRNTNAWVDKIRWSRSLCTPHPSSARAETN